MTDEKQGPPPGHAPECDGTCGEAHDKAAIVHSLEMSVAHTKANNKDVMTWYGNEVLDRMLATMREIRDDVSIPDTSSVLTAMQIAGFRAFQMAGALDMIARSACATTGTKAH